MERQVLLDTLRRRVESLFTFLISMQVSVRKSSSVSSIKWKKKRPVSKKFGFFLTRSTLVITLELSMR